MIIKLKFQLPLALTMWSLLLLLLPLCEARELHEDRIVFPDEATMKLLEIRQTNPVVSRNETTQQETVPTKSINETILELTEQTTNEMKENSTEQSSNMTAESPALGVVKKAMPNKVEFGPRITLDTLPICGEGLKLFGNHCRKEA